jgi:hypothetical protein
LGNRVSSSASDPSGAELASPSFIVVRTLAEDAR